MSTAATISRVDRLAPVLPKPHLRPPMIARALIALVRLYQQMISPWLGRVCRFEPSCSRYAVACLETHGAGRGSLLSLRRLCKCHPFHPGGFDPPPKAPRRLSGPDLDGAR